MLVRNVAPDHWVNRAARLHAGGEAPTSQNGVVLPSTARLQEKVPIIGPLHPGRMTAAGYQAAMAWRKGKDDAKPSPD